MNVSGYIAGAYFRVVETLKGIWVKRLNWWNLIKVSPLLNKKLPGLGSFFYGSTAIRFRLFGTILFTFYIATYLLAYSETLYSKILSSCRINFGSRQICNGHWPTETFYNYNSLLFFCSVLFAWSKRTKKSRTNDIQPVCSGSNVEQLYKVNCTASIWFSCGILDRQSF